MAREQPIRHTAKRPSPAREYSVTHLFPGQGDFSVTTLLSALTDNRFLRHIFAGTFAEIDEAARLESLPAVGAMLLSDKPPNGRTLAAAPVGTVQLAMYGASLATHRALTEAGWTARTLVAVSFGEIAALTAAGALDPVDGARMACRLARCMASCEGGLLLLEAPESAVGTLIRSLPSADLAVACVNDPGETVVSGPEEGIRALADRAGAAGVVCRRLRLPFAPTTRR